MNRSNNYLERLFFSVLTALLCVVLTGGKIRAEVQEPSDKTTVSTPGSSARVLSREEALKSRTFLEQEGETGGLPQGEGSTITVTPKGENLTQIPSPAFGVERGVPRNAIASTPVEPREDYTSPGYEQPPIRIPRELVAE